MGAEKAAGFRAVAFPPQGDSLLKGGPSGKQRRKIGVFLIVAGVEDAVLGQNDPRLFSELPELAKCGVNAVHAPARQCFGHKIKLPVLGDAVKEIRLLADVQAFVKPVVQAGKRGAADHGARHGDPLPAHELTKNVAALRLRRFKETTQRLPAIEQLGVGTDQADFAVRPEEGDLLFKLCGEPDVVAIKKGDVFATALRQSQIAGRAKGRCRLRPENADLRAVARGNGRAFVR